MNQYLFIFSSSTFQDVQDNTDQIWKFQRYRLVFEYYDSPIFPPPINIISYLFSLIHYMKNKSRLKKKFKNGEDFTERTSKG